MFLALLPSSKGRLIYFLSQAQLDPYCNNICTTRMGEFMAHFTCASSLLIPLGLRDPNRATNGIPFELRNPYSETTEIPSRFKKNYKTSTGITSVRQSIHHQPP